MIYAVKVSFQLGKGSLELNGPWEWCRNTDDYCANEEGIETNQDLLQSAARWNATIFPVVAGSA